MSQVRKSCVYDKTTRITVVADNCGSHKTPESLEHLKHLNFDMLWLPTYSPELNSIETVWGIIKRRVQSKMSKVV